MKLKKSVFMLIVMLMGIVTQIVTTIGTIQAFAESVDEETVTQIKDSSTVNSQNLTFDTQTQEEHSSEEELVTDYDEKKNVEEEASGDESQENKNVRDMEKGKNILDYPQSDLENLPKDKNGNPTILTDVKMTLNDEVITEVNPLKIGDVFQIKYKFEIPDAFGKLMEAGDYFEFDLPSSDAVQLTERQTGPLLHSGTAEVYGEYIAETNGHVTLIFNELLAKNDSVFGELMFSMRIDEKKVTIPGEYPIEIPGTVTNGDQVVVIAAKEKKYIEKEYIKSEGSTIYWKVLINPSYLKIDDLKLRDSTRIGIQNVAESINIDKMVKADVNLNGDVTEKEEISIKNNVVTPDGDIDLGFDYIDQPYVLYISTPILFGVVGTIENTATLSGKTDFQKDGFMLNASATANFGKEMIKKEAGIFDKKNQTVDWTVTFNPEGIAIPEKDAHFMDYIDNGTLMEETMEVSPALPYEVIPSDDKKSFKFVFKTDVNEPVKIKYKTKITNENVSKVKNKVVIGSYEKTVSKDISGPGEGDGDGENPGGDDKSQINKSVSKSDKPGMADWTLDINKEKIALDSWSVHDKVNRGFINMDSFSLRYADGGDVPTEDYSITWYEEGKGLSRSFKLNYHKATSKHFIINYTTTLDGASSQTNGADYTYTFKGKPKFDNDSKTFVPEIIPEIGLAKSGKFDPEKNEIIWTVVVNDGKNKEKIGPDNLLIDPINDDQEYVKDSAEVFYQYGTRWEPLQTGKVNFDQSKNQLEVSNLIETNYAHKVVFRTKLKKPSDILNKTIENTAYYTDKNTPKKPAKGTLEIANKNDLFLKKSGTVDPIDQTLINWTVDVNPYEQQLKDLEIFDDNWKNQIVVRDSINLRYAHTNVPMVEGIDYVLNYTERGFHIKMNQDVTTKLLLTYQGRILFPNGTRPGSEQEVSNSVRMTAKYVYTTEKPIEVKIPVKVPDSSGTIQGKTRNLNVKKVSEDNPNEVLSGAEFVLYRGKEKDPGKVVNRVTTNNSGDALFDKLTKGDYLLVETKAPSGYGISNEMKNGRVVSISDDQTTTIEEIVKDPIAGSEKLIDFPVKKKWEKVPSNVTTPEVTVRLYADGDEKDSMKLNRGNNYEGTFKDLPEKENGKMIEYTVKEDSVDGYDSSVNGNVITNVYDFSETTSLSGKKMWKNDENIDVRPNEITVVLFKNEVEFENQKVKSSNDWKYIFNDLPVYDKETGKENIYRVEERDIPDGYISEVDNQNNITNTYSKEPVKLIAISGEKKWNDNDNALDTRPDKIKVELFRNNGYSPYRTQIVSSDSSGHWKYTFEDLPERDEDGDLYNYHVKEEKVDGYTTEGFSDYGLVNTYDNNKTIEIKGNKLWFGDDDNYDNRPDEVTVHLLQNGHRIKETKATESSNWQYKFTDLAEFDDKLIPYKYTVEEEPVEGYTTEIDGTTIKNTYESSGKVSLHGEKKWEDNDNSNNTRPGYIFVNLYQNGVEIDYQKVKPDQEDGKWNYSFEDLEEKDENGKPYVYTVRENIVPLGYTSKVEGNDIYNTLNDNEFITIEGEKFWKDFDGTIGRRPSSVTVQLERKIKNSNNWRWLDRTYTKAPDWKYKFENQLKYDEYGDEYEYRVVEMGSDSGYTPVYSEYDITNIPNNPKTKIEGWKRWEDNDNEAGLRPETIEIYLYQDGKKIETKTLSGNSSLPNDWKYTFDNLDVYNMETGEKYVYTLEEKVVPNYETTYPYSNRILNTFTPNEKTRLDGEKIWNDNNDAFKKRPSEITVELYQGTTLFDSVVVNEASDWKYTFDELPKLDNNGKEYQYSVKEKGSVPGYDTEVVNSDIVNTYQNTEITSLSGEKIWEDFDNKFNSRPSSIEVVLLQNNKVYERKTVKPDENGHWKYTFENLKIYDDDAKRYEYKVQENKVPDDYTSVVDGTNITNTYNNEDLIDLKGEKIWDDYGNKFNTRPKSITVQLLNGSEVIESKQVTPDQNGNWYYEFTELIIFDENGQKIDYTVKEVILDNTHGYVSEVVGDNIINHYVNNETINFKGEKKWDDYGNKFDTRPEEVTIQLFRNNKKIEETKTDSKKNWKYEFSNDYLVYDVDGDAYDYRIIEKDVLGYQTEVKPVESSDTGIKEHTVTNKYVNTEKTNIPVSKKWDDYNDKFDTRPEKLKVTLYENEKKELESVYLSETNDWKHDFVNLPVYDEKGKKIVYSVKEDIPDEYEQVQSGPNFINKYENKETTILQGEKIWKDGNNALSTRPGSITVVLYQNGQPMIDEQLKPVTQEVTLLNNWGYKFENLPKYDGKGNPYTYTVDEIEVDQYETSVVGNNIVNTYRNYEVIDFEGKKEWDDLDNKVKSRPESITIELYQNNAKQPYDVKEVKPDKNGNWNYKFTNLPKYDEEIREYKYTVKEKNVPHYDTEVVGNNIKNTYRNEELTEFKGQKVWFDKDNKLGKRPDSITVELYQNDGKQPFKTDTVVPDSNGDWNYSFTDLPKYDDTLTPYEYSVKEIPVNNYDSEVSSVDGTTITNTIINKDKTSVLVQKKWEDQNDKLNTRPNSIRVNLYRNNGRIPFRTQVILPNENGSWFYEFENLPKYDDELNEYQYTAKEMRVPNYSNSVVKDPITQNAVITNTYNNKEVIQVNGKKTWSDYDNKLNSRPESIQVDLFRSDSEEVYQTQKVEADENGHWYYSFNDLPKYDENLDPYKYKVKEQPVSHYDSKVDGYNINNTYRNDDKTEVKGEKRWVDVDDKLNKRPDSIVVELYQNHKKIKETTVTENQDGNWNYEFTNLDKYDADLNEYYYTVKEVPIKDYDTEIIGTTITNTYQNKDITEISGKKVWDDKSNKIDVRPDSIVVELYQNGGDKPYQTKEVKSNGTDEWSYEFTELPKYDGMLEPFVYTVKEVSVPHYETTIQGITITNKLTNDIKTNLEGKKVWIDEDNKLNKRPKSIEVDLYQNGGEQPYKTQTVTGDTTGHWSYEFKDLPMYDDNLDSYEYTVKEHDVTQYDGKVEGTTITNTYQNTDKTKLSGEKTWSDKDDKLNVRPNAIKVDLYQNGQKMADKTKVVKADKSGHWKYEFKDLPMYDDKLDPYEYTVKEQQVPHYDSQVNGNNIHNTYRNDDVVKVEGEKKWKDESNKIKSRPESIVVELYQNDGKKPFKTQTVTANETGHWYYSFDQLPKYDEELNPYTYTVKEQQVPHYESSVTGTTITNTYQNTELIKIPGQKQWNDENNKLNHRPDSITVDLYRNDGKKPYQTKEVKADKNGNWTYEFTELPKYDDKLNEYQYTVKERDVEDYTTVIEGTTIINTYKNVEVIELSGEKQWDDLDNKLNVRPGSIEVELYQNDGEKPFRTQKVTPDKDGNWNYTFSALPKYDEKLNEYQYTVKEKEVTHYDSKVEGTTITNTYRNDDVTKVNGKKIWKDEDNKLNVRPDSIKVDLYQNGSKEPFKTQKVTPDKNGNWNYTFKDLPKYDDELNAFEYTVKERRVSHYESQVNGFDITNTYQNTDMTKLVGQKFWDDDNNKKNTRPNSIIVELYQNNGALPFRTQVVTPDKNGNWKYEFTELPKYDNQLNAYQYTVKERPVAGYTATVKGNNITNTLNRDVTPPKPVGPKNPGTPTDPNRRLPFTGRETPSQRRLPQTGEEKQQQLLISLIGLSLLSVSSAALYFRKRY